MSVQNWVDSANHFLHNAPPSHLAGAAFVAVLALWIGSQLFSNRNLSKRPPGPPVSWVPFVGNYFQIKAWKGSFPSLLEKWREEYGPIYSYKVFNEITVVLSDHKMVKDVRFEPPKQVGAWK